MNNLLQNSGAVSNYIVRSEALRRIFNLAEQVAKHPAAVLIVGETGTGKEMLARCIHKHSLRCHKPWVDVNCAALPEHLIESELFGYEKGAFSGAETHKPGLFELADGGTLFLDEIGDLDPKVQVKLLRVLDGVPYFRLGGTRKVTVDVRIVAATNQDLERLVAAGKFRGDLYHRLAQFRMDIPPLRDRPDDLLAIAEHVLQEHYPESQFSSDAVAAMLAYDWPGNIRELRNCVFRAVMLAKNADREITAADLKLPQAKRTSRSVDSTLIDGYGQFERQKILDTLEQCGGNQGKAAQALGISRRTLLRKLKMYREEGNETRLGTLCLQQQRYYRAKVKTPVTVIHEGGYAAGTLLNLSLGGAAVSTDAVIKFGSVVRIRFHLPESERQTELCGSVAWSNYDGDHGIQFNDLQPHDRAILEQWLHTEMKKEGWHSDCVN
ncbi:MAG TPA: sigma 54-interacting transcriptional regulator [Candidatus Angelobacter sp.]|nr:sigma 54-interacting transcriptional regulator [Candidatus Angelobacter sp.]